MTGNTDVVDSAVADTSMAPADATASKTLQIVVTMGQSLAEGGTAFHAVENTTARYPDLSFGLNFKGVAPNTGWGAKAATPSTFQGFEPLVETGSETVVSNIVNEMISQYQAAGETSPTFVSFNTAVGGASVLQLMIRPQDIFQSVSDGLAGEENGGVFAVDKHDGSYDFYLNDNGAATFYKNISGSVTAFENFVEQLALTVQEAQKEGYTVDPTVLINWMQGQQDNYTPNYDYLLNELLDRADAAVKSILSSNAGILASISQESAHGNAMVPFQQLSVVLSRPDAIFGMPEYSVEAEYPSNPTNAADFLHVSPTGYVFYGETLGKKFYDALTGHEDAPILMDKVTQVSATSVIVHFSGVETYLVNDGSIYLAANGLVPPSNLGFGSFTNDTGLQTKFKVTDATIIGPDEVRIDFSQAITGTYKLYLGRTDEDLYTGSQLLQLNGTTLRDASTTRALAPTNGETLTDPNLYDYAPVQYLVQTSQTAPTEVSIGYDFDGDRVGDVLLGSASGLLSSWQLSPTGAIASKGAIGYLAHGQRLVASGDFDGDGRGDLLLSAKDGTLSTWTLDGSTKTGGVTLGNPGANWVAVGSGYFNADWQSDVLLRNALTGTYETWDVVGSKVSGGGTVGTPGAGWVYLATGDFNGDGKSDILFESAAGAYAVWTLNDHTITGGGMIASPGAGWFFKGVGDFNGDGKADILFENANGTYATWDMSGTAIIGGGTIGTPGPGYTFAGIADYNGDGKSDLMLREADGTLVVWALDDSSVTGTFSPGAAGNGQAVETGHGADAFATLVFADATSGDLTGMLVGTGALVAGAALGNPGSGETALATGDFSATGETDVLLRDAGGTYSIEATDGTHVIANTAIGTATGYEFRALGDFNGDGKSDILFENGAGNYALWEMSGAAIVGGGSIGTAAGFAFAAVGDLDGDGKSDIVFRNTSTGDLAVWLMNGPAIVGGGTIGNPGDTWEIKGTGDFNGDGKSDLLFEDASGNYAIWDMNGAAIIGGGAIGAPGGSWELVKIVDLNQDGKADLLFEDASGHYAAWLMNDTAIIGGGVLTTLATSLHAV
jgi:hypothetical protein